MRSAIISLVFVVLILGAGFGISGMVSSQKKPAPKLPAVANISQVSFRSVTNQSTSAQIEVNGRLTARDRVEIFSEVSGTYRSGGKLFKEGAYFRKGETLLNMSDQEFTMTLRAQKSSLMNQITLMLPDMKADYPESFPNWVAYLDSFNLDKSLPALPTAATDQERYYLTAKNIQNLYYSIKSQEARMRKYKIYAPFNGKVSQSSITEGTLVRVGQKLGEFFNPSSYEMEASVSLRDLEFIKPGSQVELSSEDIPGAWKGRVIRVSDVIDAQTQTVRVFISVNGSALKEGMYLTGIVSGQTLSDVVSLDRGLLMDDNTVFLGERDLANDSTAGEVIQGVLRKVSVQPLQYSDDQVLVKGIKNGSWVISQSIPNGYDGMTVKLFELQ